MTHYSITLVEPSGRRTRAALCASELTDQPVLTFDAHMVTCPDCQSRMDEQTEHNKDYLRQMARTVESFLPGNHGFILLVVPHRAGDLLRYVSTMGREDSVKVVKEFLIRAGGSGEDWMRHLP